MAFGVHGGVMGLVSIVCRAMGYIHVHVHVYR